MVRPVVYIEIESRECFSEWGTLVHVRDLSTVHWLCHLVSDRLTHWSNCATLQLLPPLPYLSPPPSIPSSPLPSLPFPIQPPAQPTMLTALQMATSPQSLTSLKLLCLPQTTAPPLLVASLRRQTPLICLGVCPQPTTPDFRL